MKKKKYLFLDKLNKAIEEGHVLDWKKFKQLKQQNESSPLLDKFHLMSFYTFFTNLYKKPEDHADEIPTETDTNIGATQETRILNKPITEKEVENTIKNLKGKAPLWT